MATAEGLPVFNLKTVAPACAVVGANITVIGTVVESNTVVASDITAANTPGTGVLPTSCTVNSTNGTMTQSISLGSTLNSFGGALEYTGMTTGATFYAVSPSDTTTASTRLPAMRRPLHNRTSHRLSRRLVRYIDHVRCRAYTA